MGDFNGASLSRINGTLIKHFWRKFEKFLKIYRKIENLVTLLQLTPLVGFLAMAEKIQSSRGNFS
jgi:hypothetical protein